MRASPTITLQDAWHPCAKKHSRNHLCRTHPCIALLCRYRHIPCPRICTCLASSMGAACKHLTLSSLPKCPFRYSKHQCIFLDKPGKSYLGPSQLMGQGWLAFCYGQAYVDLARPGPGIMRVGQMLNCGSMEYELLRRV